MTVKVSLMLETAINRQRELSAAVALHVKICRVCVSYHQAANRWCDDGWQLAKAYRHAETEVSDLSSKSAVAADVLF